ncbi:MAG TPA: hypothetical protein ENK54_09705 [Thiotrichales bacterium]|nr:hypothetical protein [Thiotrichales bacterium]
MRGDGGPRHVPRRLREFIMPSAWVVLWLFTLKLGWLEGGGFFALLWSLSVGAVVVEMVNKLLNPPLRVAGDTVRIARPWWPRPLVVRRDRMAALLRCRFPGRRGGVGPTRYWIRLRDGGRVPLPHRLPAGTIEALLRPFDLPLEEVPPPRR